jgi:fatty-acyl-CoA synthase
MGAVLHTLNLRLHPGELGYIARHAEDKVVIVDRSLVPLLEKFQAQVPSIQKVIVIEDDYEALLAAEDGRWDWPALDENAAAMVCYTSGTTGNPKGVVYSHRSTVLHTLWPCMVDTLGVSEERHPDAGGAHVPRGGVGLPLAATLPAPSCLPRARTSTHRRCVELMAAERVTSPAACPPSGSASWRCSTRSRALGPLVAAPDGHRRLAAPPP